jgi:hypothetical protein
MVTANSIATMEKRTRPIAVADTPVATVITNVPFHELFCRQSLHPRLHLDALSTSVNGKFPDDDDSGKNLLLQYWRGGRIRTDDLR